MRRLLPFCLAGLACAGVPASAEEQVAREPAVPYPVAQVLGAARGACSDLSSRDAAITKVAAEGWSKMADPYATPVGELVRLGYDAGRKMVHAQNGKLDHAPMVFSRQVAGERLNLVLSSIHMDGVAVLGCRTYDVGETRRIEPAAATAWAGREPDQLLQRDELTKYTWEPGLLPGQDSFEIFYVPAGSPLIALVKMSGIAIKADQVSDLPR